ncbi:MAG: hypothetical protein Q9225_003581 [Loekoesia sp. 1 TL-2023]
MTDMTYTPQRGGSESMNDRQIPWTEQIARHRPRAPIRRLSASEEIRPFRNSARRQQSAFADGTPDEDYERRNEGSAKFFGFPAAVTQSAKMSDALELDLEVDPIEDKIGASTFVDGGSNINPFSPERQQKTLRFADEIGIFDDPEEDEPTTMTVNDQLRHAFAVHALNQGHGGGLRNEFASSALNPTIAAQGPSARLRLTIRPRTLILGHKAGLWLKDYSFNSFCGLAQALMIHDWQTFCYPEIFKSKKKFFVEIENGKKPKSYSMTLLHPTSRRSYETKILPVIRGNEPKPRIRVRIDENECGFDCGCDDSRELEIDALDVGFLTILAEWHRWEEKPKVLSNSKVFETTMFDLLFPSPAFDDHDEFDMQMPNGHTFRLIRGTEPLLSAEVQKALSCITTKQKQPGVKPSKIKLWPSNRLQLDRSQDSPSQKSPGVARAEGTIFVHRPARSTLFRYDAPYTMGQFFKLARSELYPDTRGKLQLRISPSETFRNEGKLLAPISENRSGYTRSISGERTLEEWWKEEILDKWLAAEEDVWAIKIFDFIRVFDGTQIDKEIEIWDMSGFRDIEMGEDSLRKEWSVPPESIMDRLAVISKSLLDIDPRVSSKGIVLHVIRDTPTGNKKEWLQWGAKLSFVQFMLEVLYKIDGDAIAIYPGDYAANNKQEESNDSTVARTRETAENMRRAKIRDQAVQIISQNPRRPFLGAAPASNVDRGVNRSGILNQNPTSPFIRAGGSRVQFPSSTRSPGRNYFAEALSPAKSPQTYSHSDMGLLRQRLNRAENEILMREESCKVCGMVFLKSTSGAENTIREHYRSHATPRRRSCPHEGCLEDLEDRNRYPSYQLILQHISSHEGLFQSCSKPHCHCPLELLTPKQFDEHRRLHPNTSFDRTLIQEPSRDTLRETATQTDPQKEFEEPKPRSNDSLNDLPGEHSKRLRCDVCMCIVNELSDWERTAHAQACRTSVENFGEMSMRPGKSKWGTKVLESKQKVTKPRTKGQKRGQSVQPETPALDTEATDAPETSQEVQGRQTRLTSRKIAGKSGEPQSSLKTLPTVLEVVSAEVTAADNATSKTVKTTTSKIRSGSVAPTTSSVQASKSTVHRTTRAGSAPATLATPTTLTATDISRKGRGPETTALEDTSTVPTRSSQQKRARKPRAKKPPPDTETPDTGIGPSITTAPTQASAEASQPKARKPRAKTTKAEDTAETPQDQASAGPSKPPACKPRAKKTKVEDDVAPDTEATDQQPSKPARKPRAKKTAQVEIPDSQESATSSKGKGKEEEAEDNTTRQASVPGTGGEDAAVPAEEGEQENAEAGSGKRKRKATAKAAAGTGSKRQKR